MPMTLLHYVEIENSKQINHTLHCNEKARTLCQVTYAYDGFLSPFHVPTTTRHHLPLLLKKQMRKRLFPLTSVTLMPTLSQPTTILQKISRRLRYARSARLTTHSVHAEPNFRNSATLSSRKSIPTAIFHRKATRLMSTTSTRSSPMPKII